MLSPSIPIYLSKTSDHHWGPWASAYSVLLLLALLYEILHSWLVRPVLVESVDSTPSSDAERSEFVDDGYERSIGESLAFKCAGVPVRLQLSFVL